MKKLVKNLKFWSRKKKNKKNKSLNNYTPHRACHCCSSCSSTTTQPSAPPLPSWYDTQQNIGQVSAPLPMPSWYDMQQSNEPVSGHVQEPPFATQENVVDNTTTPLYASAVPVVSSYQQYTVPNPVYGLPVSHASRRERSAGVFGCVVNSGAHLVRCFCPCFSIRDRY